MAEVSGTTDRKFASLRGVLSELIDDGEDVGASVAVRVDGEPVVDIWGPGSTPNGPPRGARTPS